MRTRKWLTAAFGALALGVAAAAPMAVAAAPPAAAGAIVCGFLNDGSGSGSSDSIFPSTTPYAGEQFTQVNTGAWKMCLNLSDGHLYPLSADTWCEANNSNYAKLRGCDTHPDQGWAEINVDTSNGTFNLQNGDGGYLCADGGVGSDDIIVPALSDCSSYHSTWHFS